MAPTPAEGRPESPEVSREWSRRDWLDPLPTLVPSPHDHCTALGDEPPEDASFEMRSSRKHVRRASKTRRWKAEDSLLERLEGMEAQLGDLKSSQSQARDEAQDTRRKLASMEARIDEHIAQSEGVLCGVQRAIAASSAKSRLAGQQDEIHRLVASLQSQLVELRSWQSRACEDAEDARRDLASVKAKVDEHSARPEVASSLGEGATELGSTKSEHVALVTKKHLEEHRNEMRTKLARVVTVCALLDARESARQDEAQKLVTKMQTTLDEHIDETWARWLAMRAKDNVKSQLQIESLEAQLRAVAGLDPGKIQKAEVHAKLKCFKGELDEAKLRRRSRSAGKGPHAMADAHPACQHQAFVNG